MRNKIIKGIKNKIQLDDWIFNKSNTWFTVSKYESNDFYHVNFSYPKNFHSTEYDAGLYVGACVHKYEFIKSLFFKVRNPYNKNFANTTYSISVNRAFNLDKGEDLTTKTIDVWVGLWKELFEEVDRCKEPKYLYEKSFKQKILSSSPHPIRLIAAKLSSEELYVTQLELLQPILHRERHTERELEFKRDMLNMIEYLNTLDSKEYLESRIWERTQKNPKDVIEPEIQSIFYTDRTAIIALQKQNNQTIIQDLEQLFNVAKFVSGDELTASEVTKMNFSDEFTIDVLDYEESTIIFIQNPLVFDRFDIREASELSSVTRFMIDKESTNSLRIDYWKNGEEVLQYIDINGEAITNRASSDFDLQDQDPIVMVENIFSNVTGRDLMTIKADEKVKRYTSKIRIT